VHIVCLATTLSLLQDEECGQDHVIFLEFYTPEIFLERLKLQTSHCVYWLATCSISLVMTGYSERAWLGSCDPFLHFGAQNIPLEWMKLDISNVVCRLNVKSTGITHVKVLQYGGAFRVIRP